MNKKLGFILLHALLLAPVQGVNAVERITRYTCTSQCMRIGSYHGRSYLIKGQSFQKVSEAYSQMQDQCHYPWAAVRMVSKTRRGYTLIFERLNDPDNPYDIGPCIKEEIDPNAPIKVSPAGERLGG